MVIERSRTCTITFSFLFLLLLGHTATVVAEQTIPVVHQIPTGLPQFFSLRDEAKAKATFGQFLFFSPLLSGSGEMSCSSCHTLERSLGGDSPNDVSTGGLTVRRMPPALVNLYAARLFMWDGRAVELENQVRLPLSSQKEMNVDWARSLAYLTQTSDAQRYLEAVRRVELTSRDVEESLAEFVSRLISAKSPFDSFYFDRAPDAINADAKRGLALFSGQARCSSCHLISGDFALFTDNSFHVIGAGNDPRDLGRFLVTGDPRDIGAFKTPTLRNVLLRKAYMHDGSMKTIREVLEFYNKGGNGDNLDEKIVPLNLTLNQIKDLEAFLSTLSGGVAVIE